MKKNLQLLLQNQFPLFCTCVNNEYSSRLTFIYPLSFRELYRKKLCVVFLCFFYWKEGCEHENVYFYKDCQRYLFQLLNILKPEVAYLFMAEKTRLDFIIFFQ